MRVLLFAMPNVFYGSDRCVRFPNHGLVSLAGNVDPSICELKVVDLVLVRKGLARYVLKLLKAYEPQLIGLSCMSFQYATALEIARLVKGYNPRTSVVLGGYHPTLMYEEIAQGPDASYIDFIIRGEGEATFSKLIEALSRGSDFEEIPGLSFKADGGFTHNPPRELLPLTEIRLPKREARIIKKGFHVFGVPADTVETSRGCVRSCNFCSIIQMYGRTFRKYELDRVMEDIRRARAGGARAIFFVDDNITLDLDHFEALCEAIISYRLDNIHYAVQASVRVISSSQRLVEKMARAGFKLVFLGIENVSRDNLAFFSKDYTSSRMAEVAVHYLRENNIITVGGFIVGNPEDGLEDLWANFHYARNLRIDSPVFFIATPYPKTGLRAELMEKGLITNPDDFSTYSGGKANVRTRFLSAPELEYAVWQMYKRYFDLDYLKFNKIKRLYPLYFIKLLLGALPEYIGNKMARFLRIRGEGDFYRTAKKREVKRRKKWLLE